MSESTDIERVHWIVEDTLPGDEGGILNGISSIFSRSAAPAEFCLCSLGVFWNKFIFISFFICNGMHFKKVLEKKLN